MSEQTETLPTPPPSTTHQDNTTEASSQPKIRLTDVEVENEGVALNLLVQFLGLAQKRGAFTIDEAAKIWECVKQFQKTE